jgi:MFS family permease
MTNEAVTYRPIVSEAEGSSRTRRTIGLVLLLGVSYMFNAMDRQVFPALLASIRADYELTLPQSGFVSTIFTVNVAIFAALSGWFMARFGRRYVLLGGLVSYSLFTLLTPFATGFVSLTLLRALTGVGEALQVGAVFACMGAYFGARRGAAMSAMHSLVPCWARVSKAGRIRGLLRFTSMGSRGLRWHSLPRSLFRRNLLTPDRIHRSRATRTWRQNRSGHAT